MWATTMFRNCLRGLTGFANSCKKDRRYLLLLLFSALVFNSYAYRELVGAESSGNLAKCEGNRWYDENEEYFTGVTSTYVLKSYH